MLALEVAHEAQLACCNGAIVDVYHENCSWDRVCVSASGYGNAIYDLGTPHPGAPSRTLTRQ